jgi:curved DNA-binding protein CbpA
VTDDPYAVLGLDQRATSDDVRRAYFRLVRQNPPEAHPEEFKRIRAAYETLRSPLRRAELALVAFGGPANEIDLDLIAQASERGGLDPFDALLATELRNSNLTRTDFSADHTSIRAEDLLKEYE